MRRSVLVLAGIGFIAHFLTPKPAQALNVQLLRPSTGHVRGYQVFTSETLPKYHLALGLNFNLANHPLELTPAGSTSRLSGVVDQFVTADFLISYGLLDWLTLNLDMPVNLYHNIAPTFIPSRDQGGGDPGDLMINAKIRIFDAEKTGPHLGLAVVPFITVPTGEEEIFFGDSSLTGGAVIVGDAQIKSNRIYLNVGARFREEETIEGLVVNEEFVYGAGFQRPLVKNWGLDIIAELFGSTKFGKFATEDITSPLEGLVVLQKKWLENRRLITHLGGGVGLTNGYGLPNFRALLSVAYAWNLKKEEEARPVAAPLPEVIDVKGKINFEYDRAVIKPESYPLLDDVAVTLKKHTEFKHIRIEGHTDSRGSEAYNQKLSEKRAEALKTYLVGKGIEADRLSTIGYGESQPIADNKTDAGRAENRRSVFRIVRE
jgi:outer membrane protein OmpA-like peptidoglycan-associated protein